VAHDVRSICVQLMHIMAAEVSGMQAVWQAECRTCVHRGKAAVNQRSS